MESQIYNIAILGYLDERLDELKEEYGDLPHQLKKKEKTYKEAKNLFEETKGIIEDIKKFCSTSKVTLVELKNKEEKLAKQQFQVRNNKEFDAITKEIEHLKSEHETLSDKLRTEGVKVENLKRIMDDQQAAYAVAENDVNEKREEIKRLSTDQNDELLELEAKRKVIVDKIDSRFYEEYERIREHIPSAAAKITRNSCSGCFSAIPPQIVVESRNNLDKAYFCENCGRILTPEDFTVDDDMIDEIQV